MIWLVIASLIYSFFFYPIGDSGLSSWQKFFLGLFLGGPAYVFMFYSLAKGLVQVGVLS